MIFKNIFSENGDWSKYEDDWSKCSESCLQFKNRTCNDPRPAFGGKCVGEDKKFQFCNDGDCEGNINFICIIFFSQGQWKYKS